MTRLTVWQASRILYFAEVYIKIEKRGNILSNRVLSILRKNKDEFCSGEELAKQLKISRTAVWKHIRALRKEGYSIASHKKRGYVLEAIPDLLLPEEIQYNLRTKILGKKIYYFSQTDSTIDQMKKLIEKQIPEGTLVVAERQLQGRGRLQRKWESPFGGVWFSIFLKPNVLPALIPQLNLISALVVARTIKSRTGIEACLKWPNDVVIKCQKKGDYPFKKICGILIEMNAEMDKINHLILSFGINVNITGEQFPVSLRDKVVSLHELLGREISRVNFLKELLRNLEEVYLKFKEGNTTFLLKEYKKNSIVLGKKIKVIFPDKQVVTGKAVDIDKEGALILKSGGKKERVVAGEINLLN